MTLVEFLRARLDEDEATATAAARSQLVIMAARKSGKNGAHAFWSRHDPPRVLAEVDAKRQIVHEHHPTDPCDAHDASLESVACPTLRLLALPYADYSDYDPEWRP